MLARIVAAILIAVSALVALPGDAARADPRGWGRGRGRGRGRGYYRPYYTPVPDYNPLPGFLGGLFGGWLADQMTKDDEPRYREDDDDAERDGRPRG